MPPPPTRCVRLRSAWPTSRCSAPTASPADALGVVDTDPASRGYGQLIDQVELPRRRQRAPPPGVECLQLASVPLGPRCTRRAPLPDRAGHRLVAHPRHRHQAQPATAGAGEGDRARGAGPPNRVHSAAHGALRSRRHLSSTRSARPAATGPADSSRSITSRSRSAGAGSVSADRSTWPTTSPGTWVRT